MKGFQLLGLETFIHNCRFDTPEKQIENREALRNILDKVVRARKCDEWLKLFDDPDIPVAPVYNLVKRLSNPKRWKMSTLPRSSTLKRGAYVCWGFPSNNIKLLGGWE